MPANQLDTMRHVYLPPRAAAITPRPPAMLVKYPKDRARNIYIPNEFRESVTHLPRHERIPLQNKRHHTRRRCRQQCTQHTCARAVHAPSCGVRARARSRGCHLVRVCQCRRYRPGGRRLSDSCIINTRKPCAP